MLAYHFEGYFYGSQLVIINMTLRMITGPHFKA